MANVNDLRYLRTETSIIDAFIELVGERPVRSVSAMEICRRAGISRNAFYLHYASVAALYASLVDDVVVDVRKQCERFVKREGNDEDIDFLIFSALMDVLTKHERLFRALLPSDDGSLAKQLAEGIENAYSEVSATTVGEKTQTLSFRLMNSYASWALVGLLIRWVADTDRPLSEASDDFERLHTGVTEIAKDFLRGNQ